MTRPPADQPKILSRRRTRISPWIEVIEREVEFKAGAKPELYHALGQQDYLAIVARTPDDRIPIVRQYRPALEAFTWELPAGLVDPGEPASVACARELKEETGLAARKVHALGDYAPCSARLSNRVHSFFVETEGSIGTAGEPGIEVRLVSLPELARLIRSGEFTLQLHLGALLLAGMAGHLELSVFAAVGKSPV
jgi:8-oxo-dGTP pyrophosphatase MutT (NUDIX family)